MRFSALIVAACALLLLGASGPPASPGKAPPPPTTLLAFDWQAHKLMRVDPLTLARKGTSLSTVRPVWHAYSPDADRLVLAADTIPTTLEVVDVRAMRSLGHLPGLGSGSWIDALLWADPGRIVALVRTEAARAVTLDVGKRRVLSSVSLPGAVVATAVGPNAIAILAGPAEGIGPSRLHVVDSLGHARTATLARVRSGWTFNRDTGNGRRVQPGVALDAGGKRAIVIQPTGPAAEIDLATMEVTYHELRQARSLAGRFHDWLEPKAHAKSVLGPELWARSVGEQAVAVASWEHTGIRTKRGEARALVRAHGVFLVDTQNWTRRTLSKTASGIATAGDVALLYAGPFANGGPFAADEGRSPRGLDAYGADGRRRFRLFGSRVVGNVQGAGAYAYVRVSRNAYDVVDVRTGRVLGRARTATDVSLLPLTD